MDNNNFDFDKTFDNLYKLAKQQFKDVDDHFIKVCIYGYIYTNILGQNFENETNEDYIKAQKHYNITEYENEASKIAKSCDIKGDTVFDLNKFYSMTDYNNKEPKINKFCKLNI